eukprot:TRINITY_DN13332_c0_g1_i2.p1 TRINITY_DN13332_c0_g1~~TRINITY_DN13332_c0_g1_i2.p1  ORF type:complete len:273 (-),score=21.23 TRINITY_DN13332_c0_g1_i2:175-993(-)
MADSAAQQTSQLVVPSRWAKAPLLILCCAPLATVTVTYPMALADGRVDSGHFFISSSIDQGVEKRVGVIGLGISSLALALVALQRYTEMTLLAQRLPQEVSLRLHCMNRIALGCAFVSAFGMLGVSAFNVSYRYVVHYTFAFAGFHGLFAYCLIQTWIDRFMLSHNSFCSSSSKPTTSHRCRVGLCCMSTLGIIVGTTTFNLGYLPAAALCELLVFGTQILYFWTWLLLSRAGDAKEVCISHVSPPLAGFAVQLTVMRADDHRTAEKQPGEC